MKSENMSREEKLRRQRIRKRREARRRRAIRNRIVFGISVLVLLIMIVSGIRFLGHKLSSKDKKNDIAVEQLQKNETAGGDANDSDTVSENDIEAADTEADSKKPRSLSGEVTKTPVFFQGYEPEFTGSTQGIVNEEVNSTYGILVDLDNGHVVASKNARDTMYPASMTKILTVLVAAEHIESASELDKKVAITQDITDYVFRNGCSAVNWDVGEEVTVRDLFYGTVLPSGGDAALALAVYTAGSQEAFVALMNEKVGKLGLKNSHFTNCIGTFNEDHYSTAADMAMIMKAACENDIARDALSMHRYETTKTEQHPDGIDLSNWFLRKIEDKDCHGTVVAAKTGYVVQSGNCAASYTVSNAGKNYVCVTGQAHSSWRCIYDHVAIYEDFIS